MKAFKFVLVLALTVFALPAFAQEELTETFSGDGYTFQYPSGWSFESFFGQILGSNSADFMTSGESTLAENQINLFITNSFTAEEMGVEEGASLEDIAVAATEQMSTEDNVDFSEISTIQIGEHEALRIGVQDAEFEGALLLMDVAGNYIGIIAQANVGEFAQFEETVLAIAATIEYDPSQAPDLSDFGSSSSGGMDTSSAPQATVGSENIPWQLQAPNNYDADSFGGQNGLTVGADDTIYVADNFNGIMTISVDGSVQNIQKLEDVFSYDDIAIASDGTFWVTDTFESRLLHLDAEGNVIATVGEEGNADGQFGLFSPKSIELDAEGNIYAFDTNTDDAEVSFGRVQVFSPDGTFIRSIQVSEPDGFGFTFNAKLALDPNGNLYVADTGFGGIRVFDPEGNVLVPSFVESLFEFASIGGIDIDADGMIYVVTSEAIIYKLDAEGNIVTQFNATKQEYQDELPPFTAGEFYSPTGLEVLSDGSLVILDTNYSHSQIVRVTLP